MLTSVLKGMSRKQVITLLAVLFTCCQIIVGEETLYHIEPRQNLWVTWAKKMGQSAFCLSLASATEPFRTCLIGVPSYNVTHFANYSAGRCTEEIQVSSCSAKLSPSTSNYNGSNSTPIKYNKTRDFLMSFSPRSLVICPLGLKV